MQADPTGAAYVDGGNLYQSENSNPINRLDPTGLRQISFAFDAFINGNRRGFWLDEPVVFSNILGYTTVQFGTDARGFGGFNFNYNDANARLYHYGWIESTKIGKLSRTPISLGVHGQTYEDSTTDALVPGEWAINVGAGYSHRRKTPFWSTGPTTWTYFKQRTTAIGLIKISNPSSCSSLIHVENSGDYPFRLSPEIIYHIDFLFTRTGPSTVRVKLTGTHTKFPDFEAYLDGGVIYRKFAPDLGPGLNNLGAVNEVRHPNRTSMVSG